MPEEADPLPADRYRHILAAETHLADLDLFEDLADLHDTEACPVLKARFAQQYGRVLGIHPEERGRFRQCLEELRNRGDMPVEDLIARMRSQMRPPSSSAAGS